jgi:hypothetical protein|tara:strand:- start:50 stop:448 length:399 start_codon:yes stop_codon:yes gene_type:complete
MSYMPPIKSDVHITPDRVWDMIKEEWGYEKEQFFDPCPVNPQWNGLDIDWRDLNYVNPPYSRERGDKKTLLTQFVEKALDEKGTTIMLLPSKTDQEWFHKIKEFDIMWIRGRLKFVGNEWSATQPHFLVKIN